MPNAYWDNFEDTNLLRVARRALDPRLTCYGEVAWVDKIRDGLYIVGSHDQGILRDVLPGGGRDGFRTRRDARRAAVDIARRYVERHRTTEGHAGGPLRIHGRKPHGANDCW